MKISLRYLASLAFLAASAVSFIKVEALSSNNDMISIPVSTFKALGDRIFSPLHVAADAPGGVTHAHIHKARKLYESLDTFLVEEPGDDVEETTSKNITSSSRSLKLLSRDPGNTPRSGDDMPRTTRRLEECTDVPNWSSTIPKAGVHLP